MTRDRLEASVRVGQANGVGAVAITEHLYRFREAFDLLRGWWEADPDPMLRELTARYWEDHATESIADYVRLVEGAKADGLPVLLGLEMDWIAGHGDALARFLAPYDWDIVLGSVHWIGAWGFDEVVDEWDRRDVAETWGRYGALVGELAESGLADVLTHPDLPKVFGHRPSNETPLHEAIVASAARSGLAIELNSNGLNKPVRETYPASPLVRRARERGLAITFASDAHAAERVGENFDLLATIAREAGFSTATAFIGRTRSDYPI